MTFPELKGCGGSNISLSPAQINAKKKKDGYIKNSSVPQLCSWIRARVMILAER